MVGRILNVVSVVQVVLVVARLAVSVRKDVAGRRMNRDRSAAAGAAWCPLNVLTNVVGWNDSDALLAVMQLTGDGVVDHAGEGTFNFTDFRRCVGQQAQERKRKVFLTHTFKTTCCILLEITLQCQLSVGLDCYFIFGHD